MQDTFTFTVNMNLREYLRLGFTLLPRIKVIRRIFLLILCATLPGLASPGENTVKPHLIRGIEYRFTHWGMEVSTTRISLTLQNKSGGTQSPLS